MARRWTILCALLCWGLIGCKAKSAAETKIPQEEVDRKNPVESDPTSIAEGKRLYGATDCALCHGKDGDGKGVLAKDINMNLHDWRKPDPSRISRMESFPICFEGQRPHARLRWQGNSRAGLANHQLCAIDARKRQR